MVSTVERFVGKAIRQWRGLPSEVWLVTTPRWTVNIMRVEGQLLPFRWIVGPPGSCRSIQGWAPSLREAEQAAEIAVLAETKKYRGVCCVCGSSASNRRIIYHPVRVVLVCDRHEAVCREHFKDPCAECDAR